MAKKANTPNKKTSKKAPNKKALQLIERIKKDNAAYKVMTSLERRVVVAKEIRTMLKKRTFSAEYGYGRVEKINNEPSYHNLPVLSSGLRGNMPLGDLQPIIRAGGFECTGCAKAAVIIARAAVGNEVRISLKSLDNIGNAKPLADKVSKEVFGAQCADVIECLYEEWKYGENGYFWNDRFKSKDPFKNNEGKAEAFNNYVESISSLDLKKRMDEIFENIVKNKGYLVIGEYKF
jgi:hypothetical protein